jgi:hypothetical protein
VIPKFNGTPKPTVVKDAACSEEWLLAAGYDYLISEYDLIQGALLG